MEYMNVHVKNIYYIYVYILAYTDICIYTLFAYLIHLAVVFMCVSAILYIVMCTIWSIYIRYNIY